MIFAVELARPLVVGGFPLAVDTIDRAFNVFAGGLIHYGEILRHPGTYLRLGFVELPGAQGWVCGGEAHRYTDKERYERQYDYSCFHVASRVRMGWPASEHCILSAARRFAQPRKC